jgi:alpha-D-xyloside xylohydrolase
MAGEYLLVAPMFTGQTSRKVILPKGNWYDFYTGVYAGNGEIITVTPGLDKIPVYVKDGGMIPMMPARLQAPKLGEKVDIEIRHYGEKPAHIFYTTTTGKLLNYEKGDFSWRALSVSKDKQGKWKGSISSPVKGKPNTIGSVSWRLMTIQR